MQATGLWSAGCGECPASITIRHVTGSDAVASTLTHTLALYALLCKNPRLFIPLDLLNHCNHVQNDYLMVSPTAHDSAFQLHTTTALREGDQLCINYAKDKIDALYEVPTKFYIN